VDVDEGAPAEAVVASTAAPLTTPAGMGRYCNMTWSTGGWAFASYQNLVNDPCAYIRSVNGWDGTIARAGLYAVYGMNNVVARCDGGGYVLLYTGYGQNPLTWAYNGSLGHSSCTFTVSPRELPIFGRVYDPAGYQFTNTGFDFARNYTVDARNELGDTSGTTAATKVDWRGKDMSSWGYDNHDAWDINMAAWTAIYAAADGVVQKARFRDVSLACPGGYTDPNQGEVYIRHEVSGGSAYFNEVFVSYYAHFNYITVTDGQFVRKGDLIGYSGTTGCSSGPHLHFGVFRLSNTASAYRYPFTINTDFTAGHDQNSANGYQIAIDPHGFYPAKGFDPWAWRGYPWGALSVNLWESGAAPPDGSW